MNWHLFTAFLLLTLVLVLIPGPIVTLVIATGATRGVRAALATVAGTSIGNAVLLAAIALGLGFVLNNAVYLFDILRLVGAAYLIWLGIRAWRGGGDSKGPAPGDRVHFRRGLVVALFNPKTIAFFTAFLPQFIDPGLPAAPQLALMCITSVLLAVVTDSCWALAAGLGHAWLVRPAQARLLARLSGITLIGGGIWLSLARRPG
jgi:threonine/homoserine/homoserine lactone efflux protein